MTGADSYWGDLGASAASIPGASELYGSRIFVTGATGMICSSVIDILLFLNRAHGADITVFAAGRSERDVATRFRGFSEADGLVFVPYDATSSDAVALADGVDFIIHGASNANPAMYMQRPVETMLANIVGLSTMFDLARANSARRLLYVSSSEVYGQQAGAEPYSEGDYGYLDILNERAGYPSSKRAGESLCVAYGMEHSVESVIVRPGHIYGPSIRMSDNRASAEFTRKAVAGEDVVLKSRGNQLRSYCFSLDCASAMLTVLLRGERANAYNISNADSICTIGEIGEALAKAGGVDVVYDIPEEAKQTASNLMENSSLSSGKLEGLGWRPAFSLRRGAERTIAILRENNGRLSI
ncbi:NAD(P)-dependent oxidoreductase [uncultured Agrococcus sp.]|uniref:NAD-dependent epimerase/dehydratase family protein n=1 Tax=uncultured Agrococcus sp. TaxID=382258 RepID=UPI0025F21DBA|nr:NAD-dependent epimerase/dehydratase family protein [uncultured Agrococcus sp.]